VELPNRPQLEATFARRLSLLSSRHRQELVRLLGNPPDPQRVPASFWAKVEREHNEELFLMLLLVFMASGEFHGLDEANARQLAQPWAQQRSQLVSRGYVTSSQERLSRVATRWRERQTTVARDRDFPPEAAPSVSVPQVEVEGGALEVFGPERDESIAVTETTTAQSAGGEGAAEATGTTSADDLWITENDGLVCPVCRPLHQAAREDWTRFFPSGPPAHPRCRCFVRYAAMVPQEVGAN